MEVELGLELDSSPNPAMAGNQRQGRSISGGGLVVRDLAGCAVAVDAVAAGTKAANEETVGLAVFDAVETATDLLELSTARTSVVVVEEGCCSGWNSGCVVELVPCWLRWAAPGDQYRK